jgi:hypothetical protein
MKASSGTQKSSIQFHPEVKSATVNMASLLGKETVTFIKLIVFP